MEAESMADQKERTTLNWKTLVELEPILKRLEPMAELADAEDWQAWESVKRQLSPLVGWAARDAAAELQTSTAWDVAYQHLLRRFEGTDK